MQKIYRFFIDKVIKCTQVLVYLRRMVYMYTFIPSEVEATPLTLEAALEEMLLMELEQSRFAEY